MDGQNIGRWSAEEAIRYDDFATRSFSWRYIEKPSLRTLVKPYITTKTVALDLGCGGGRIISMLRDLGVAEKFVYGLDSNPTLVDLARKRFPDANIIRTELTNTPYPGITRSVDLATAHLVLQYLSADDLSTCFKEVRRLLKPGGWMAIGVPHPMRVIEQAESCYFSRKLQVVRAPWGGVTTSSGLTISDHVNVAIAAGFNIVRMDEPEIAEHGNLHREAASYSSGPTRLMMLMQATDLRR
jgi:trans-aconitate methyltransferase